MNLNIIQAKAAWYFKDIDVLAFSLWSFVHGIFSLVVRDRVIMVPAEKIKNLATGALKFLERAY